MEPSGAEDKRHCLGIVPCSPSVDLMGLTMAKLSLRNTYCAMKLDTGRRCWLAAYTRSRHEYQVARQLSQKNLEYLLPTYGRLTRWSDRVKRVTMPLFPSYVFVNICEEERVRVLETMGVAYLVSTAGMPAVLPDEEIARLRRCLAASDLEPHPYLKIGQRVRVKHGVFAGCEGALLQKQNTRRLVVTVEAITKSISINIHSADVEPV